MSITLNRLTRKQFQCPNCNWKGIPAVVAPGNIAVEILLWIFFIIPGLIYSVWRMASKYEACPKCKNRNIVQI
jgi:predicted RNA-binding Zn-ribbon protein involved in translation (DUF1610 family)